MIGGLNTLRYFAFLSVFLYHTGGVFFSWGNYGVEFFFVLSSFLLTNLALKEYEKTGQINRKNFFIRRTLRIFPLYFLFLLIIFAILPFIGMVFDKTIESSHNPWMYFTFLANYDSSNSIFPLKFLWSISVEEQFYLFFGLIGLFFLYKKSMWILLVSVLLSVYLIYIGYFGVPVYTHTLSQLPNFTVGIILGYYYFHKGEVSFVVLVLTMLVSFGGLWLIDQEWIRYVVAAIFFGSLIFTCIQCWSLIQNLKLFKLTEYWGKYTYGLYVYSGLIILLGASLIPTRYEIQLVVIFVVLHVVAWISFEVFEKRFLQLKRRFRA